MPERNITSPKDGRTDHYTAWMTDGAIERINERYARDFDATGYRMVANMDELQEAMDNGELLK